MALELQEEVVEGAATWARQAFGPVQELRLLRPEALHVTLVFLDYQAERDIERIAELSLGAGGEAFELAAEGTVPVPRSRPRLYALDLDDAGGALGRWQASLSERLEAAGLYEPEKRPFWPHVTLARVRKRQRRAKLPRQVEVPELPAALRRPFTAGRVTLFRSTLKPSGAVYDALASTEG